MKAAEIASLYRISARVFGNHPSAWMLLILICAAGEKGLSVSEANRLINAAQYTSRISTLRRWTNAGLLTLDEGPARPRVGGRRGGRPCFYYKATEKAFKLLRIEAEK